MESPLIPEPIAVSPYVFMIGETVYRVEDLPTLALSIQQPWAWLILTRIKDVENRDWATQHRGPFLIHTGQRYDWAGHNFIQRHRPRLAIPPDLPMGGIVGWANLTDVITDRKPRGLWFLGPYGFTLADALPLPFMPVPGRLKFFSCCYELADPRPGLEVKK